MSELTTSLTIDVSADPKLPPSGLTAVNLDNGILISWQSFLQDNITGFNIYRYSRGEEPKKIGSVNADKNEYSDNSVTAGKLYFYFVTSVSLKGSESMQSEELGIRR